VIVVFENVKISQLIEVMLSLNCFMVMILL